MNKDLPRQSGVEIEIVVAEDGILSCDLEADIFHECAGLEGQFDRSTLQLADSSADLRPR